MTAPSNRPVSSIPIDERLGEVLRRSLPRMGPETRAQLEAVVSPESLAVMGGVLVAWIASHAFGLGEIIDAVLLAAGAIAVGWSVFDGVDHLYSFALLAYRAQSDRDLDLSAEHLAKTVGILGVQAALAILFHGAKAPKTGKGRPLNVGQPVAKTTGARYKPTIREDPTLGAGFGGTSLWGDIRVSSHGSTSDRAVVLLHEKVHQFLAPKLTILRNYRVHNRAGSYVRSSLWRYIEEALAETIAQVGTRGFGETFRGLSFPIRNGYLFLARPGSRLKGLRGEGLAQESGALLYIGVVVGMAFELRFENGTPPIGSPAL